MVAVIQPSHQLIYFRPRLFVFRPSVDENELSRVSRNGLAVPGMDGVFSLLYRQDHPSVSSQPYCVSQFFFVALYFVVNEKGTVGVELLAVHQFLHRYLVKLVKSLWVINVSGELCKTQ